MMTLYLRREPTTDPLIKSFDREDGHFDVQAYYDKACVNEAGRWMWHGDPPRPGCRKVFLNCYCWRAIWLPDLQ